MRAIAAEAEVAINLDMINTVSGETPHLCSLSPGGKDHIEDLTRAGGRDCPNRRAKRQLIMV